MDGRYEQDGRTASFTPAGAGLPGGTNQSRSSFSDRAVLSEMTQPSVGEGKVRNHSYAEFRRFVLHIGSLIAEFEVGIGISGKVFGSIY